MPERYSCPRCGGRLMPNTVREVGAFFVAYRCTGCEGRFFEGGDLEKIDDIIQPTLVELRRIPSAVDQQMPLTCPVCASGPVMTKVEHQRDARVVVDICPSCRGTWLDKGELSAIQKEGLLTFLVNTVKWLASLRE